MDRRGYNRYNHRNSSKLTPRQRQKIARRIMMALSAFVCAVCIILTVNCISVRSKAADNYHKYYTSVVIMPGDTLSGYFREYGENYDSCKDYIRDVYKINDLTSDKLKAGSYIILPYYSTEIK